MEAVAYTHLFFKKPDISAQLGTLRGALTVSSRFDSGAICTYKETKDYFGIPRFYNFKNFSINKIIDKTTISPIKPFNFLYTLRPQQIPLAEKFLNLYHTGGTGFLLAMPTGTGKTIMAAYFLAELEQRTLIVVPREYIAQQWRKRLLESTDLSSSDIGIAQQDRCEWEGKKIVIGMLQSLWKDKYPTEFRHAFGCLLVDEVHTIGSDKFSAIAGLYPAKYRIGLSATMKRQDGTERVYQYHIGEHLIAGGSEEMEPVIYRRAFMTSTVRGHIFKVRDKISRRGMILSALADDYARNTLLATLTHTLVKSGRQVLVLGERIAQLEDLKTLLVRKHGYTNDEVGIFIQKTPQHMREHILNTSLVVLATTQIMGMAVDAPALSALVFATPLSHIVQSVGRILRSKAGKVQPVVIDLVDIAYNDCIQWSDNRDKYYKQKGYEIRRIKG